MLGIGVVMVFVWFELAIFGGAMKFCWCGIIGVLFIVLGILSILLREKRY